MQLNVELIENWFSATLKTFNFSANDVLQGFFFPLFITNKGNYKTIETLKGGNISVSCILNPTVTGRGGAKVEREGWGGGWGGWGEVRWGWVSSGVDLRIHEKKRKKKKSMLFLIKINLFSFFFFLLFLWLANCLSPFTLVLILSTTDVSGLCKKKFMCLVQSEKAVVSVVTVMSSVRSHLPSGSQSR